MSPHRPTAADFRELARLAAPIVAIQVGMMLMGVVDTIMVGRVSAAALGAVAIGNVYNFGVSIFGMGALMALDPIISQAVGARDTLAVRRGVQRGLVFAAVLTVPTSLLLATAGPVFTFLDQPEDVAPLAAGYVMRTLPGVLPLFAFVVLRQTLQAHRRTKPILAAVIVANLLNVLLNYAWIFGHFGFPELGVLGSAWATLVCRWGMALLLLAFAWRDIAPCLAQRAPGLLELRPIGRMLWLGAPIGVQMALEYGAFGFVALMMGRLGVIEVAAHQVALNLASLAFMVPLGVSAAAAVIVGHAVGRQDPAGVRRSTRAALGVGAAFMLVTGGLFIGLPDTLARLYTNDAAVLMLAATLLPIAGVFQVFDGLQAVAHGLLRGLGDTRMPMLINVLAFWCFGIPVSLVLGFRMGHGAIGLWWGLVIGLALVATILIARLRQRESRDLVRVIIDEQVRAEGAPSDLDTVTR